MIRRLVLAAMGLVWGALVFLVSLYLTFPSDDALTFMLYQWSQANKDYSFTASKVVLWRGTGIKFKDFQLLKPEKVRRRPRSGEEEEPAEAKVVLSADSLAARFAVLPLVLGRKEISFVSDLHGGSIAGRGGVSETEWVVDATIDELDLSTLPIRGKDVSFDLEGVVTGLVDVVLSKEEPAESSGEASLQIQGFALKSGSVKGFDLPADTRFSEARVAFKIEEGKARITEGKVVGDVLDGTLEGEITLNKKFMRSRPRIQVAFTVEESYDNLLKIMPTVKDARDDEGKYHFLITGTLEHPRFYPDRTKSGRRVKTERSTTATRAPTLEAPEAEDEEGSTERRRAEREDRVRERRDRLKERRDRLRAAREGAVEPRPKGPGPEDDEMMDEPPERRAGRDYQAPPGPDDMPPEDHRDFERQMPPDDDFIPPEEDFEFQQ